MSLAVFSLVGILPVVVVILLLSGVLAVVSGVRAAAGGVFLLMGVPVNGHSRCRWLKTYRKLPGSSCIDGY